MKIDVDALCGECEKCTYFAITETTLKTLDIEFGETVTHGDRRCVNVNICRNAVKIWNRWEEKREDQ